MSIPFEPFDWRAHEAKTAWNEGRKEDAVKITSNALLLDAGACELNSVASNFLFILFDANRKPNDKKYGHILPPDGWNTGPRGRNIERLTTELRAKDAGHLIYDTAASLLLVLMDQTRKPKNRRYSVEYEKLKMDISKLKYMFEIATLHHSRDEGISYGESIKNLVSEFKMSERHIKKCLSYYSCALEASSH